MRQVSLIAGSEAFALAGLTSRNHPYVERSHGDLPLSPSVAEGLTCLQPSSKTVHSASSMVTFPGPTRNTSRRS
jgi:hypothetical protein